MPVEGQGPSFSGLVREEYMFFIHVDVLCFCLTYLASRALPEQLVNDIGASNNVHIYFAMHRNGWQRSNMHEHESQK